jgi:hypothetical protein
MTSQEKAVLAATTSCIGIGLVVTLFVWSRLNFDPSQMAQVWTLVALCFVLAGVQILAPIPTCELELLCGPRQVALPAVGAGFMWLCCKYGFDYSAFGRLFGLHDAKDGYLALGMAGGYFACEVYVAVALWKYDPFKWD